MIKQKSKIIKNAAALYCSVFTAATIISSIFQLSIGQVTDTNFHIIDRAIICLIGVFTFTLMLKLRIKNKIISYIITYAIAIPIVFAYVYATSFWAEQHPNAYRDIFLNFTVIFLVVAIVVSIKDYVQSRKASR